MHEMSDSQSIIKRMEGVIAVRELGRHQAVMMRAEAAWTREVSLYTTKRYNSCFKTVARNFTEQRFAIVDIHDPKHIIRDIATMRRNLEQLRIGAGPRKLCSLICKDLNIDHGSASMGGIEASG